jgi:hypothetical protein
MMSFAYPKNDEMRNNILLGSAALLFLIGLSQIVSFMIKNWERHVVPFERKDEGFVAVELVFRSQEQGIYCVPGDNTVEEFLSHVEQDWGSDNKTAITDGMAVRINNNDAVIIDEMAPHKKLALGIPVNINQLSPEEIMMIPGIGEKTAAAIHSYIQSKGCIRNLSELSDIPGIKERKIANMRKYFIARPTTRPVENQLPKHNPD